MNNKTMVERLGRGLACAVLLMLSFSHALHLSAQPWAKKASQAVFTLKTFKADGTLLGSSNGCFIGEHGEALSSFSPFKGADRAVVIDAQGKEWPVDCMIGANEMYDVAKFQVAVKKPTALTVARTAATQGSKAWLLPYAVKRDPAMKSGTVVKAEQFQGNYTYYTLDFASDDQQAGSPVMNDGGEVIGLLQPATDSHVANSYAVSAPFVADMQANGLSLNDAALKATTIAKAIPDDYSQAMLALYMSSTALDEVHYRQYIDRFIQKFPNAPDGYIYRARLQAASGNFSGADSDMRQAVSVAQQKDDAHYQFAQLIYQKELYQSNQPYADWSLDLALEESRAAYQENPQPVYRQQQAQILYAQKKYGEAFAIYDELTKGVLRSAETFYAAALCKLQQDDKRAALALMDSAVSTFTRPYVKTVAPYLEARAQLSMEVRRYQMAINDMQDLVALEPTNATLWAEKASYELRVNLLDQALESAQECQRLDAANSDAPLIIGIVQCLKGDKQQGLQNLNRAKDMNNPQAQTFIDKYQ